MKRISGFLLAFILFFSLLPVRGADGSNVARARAPEFDIRMNHLYLDGSPTTITYIINRYDFVWVRERDYNASLLAQLNIEDITKIPADAVPIMPDPANMLSNCYVKFTGVKLRLNFGDVILARTRAVFTSNGTASEWKALTFRPDMFAPSEALSENDLPNLAVTDSSLTVSLKTTNNIYAKYEYTLIPASPPPGFAPKWTPLGSASEWGAETKTAAFLPSGAPYTVCVRIEGDGKQDFLYAKENGIPLTTPKVLYALERIGPLAGGPDGASWYFSADGGKKWTETPVGPNEEGFILLDKIFAKKELSFQLKRAGAGSGTLPADLPAVLEGTLNPRPGFPKGVSILGLADERHPENWTMAGTDEPLEYSVNGFIWTPLVPNVGLPLLSLGDQLKKAKATPYLIRLAPSESEGLPASAPKKFTQPKQVKAPTTKPDYKKEIIKLRSGLRYCFAGADTDIEKDRFDLDFETASGEPVSIENAISGGQVIFVYTGENGKKPRSAIQKIVLVERGETPDEGQGLVLNKTSVSLQKGFEYFGSKEKWAGFTKGDEKGLVRRKATAKYNAKTGITSGLAASAPVECGVTYSEDGKSVLSIEYDTKDGIPLYSWGITSLSGGRYTAAEDLRKSVIVTNAQNGLVSFSISPSLAPEDAALAASVTVSYKNNKLEAADTYSFTNLKIGEAITLTITPRDTGAYGRTTATLTVVPPPEDPPSSVSFGNRGSYGMVTVTLPSAVPLGQTRPVRVDYVQMPEGKVVHSAKATAAYTPVPDDSARRISVDMRTAMASAGPGTYQLRAYIEGSSSTSDSAPVTTQWVTFAQADYGICYVTTNVSDANPPAVGSAVTIGGLRDAFGNDLTGAAYQWYRVSSSGTRSVITQGGNAAGFTPTGDELWCRLEVLIYCNNLYFTHEFPWTIYPSS